MRTMAEEAGSKGSSAACSPNLHVAEPYTETLAGKAEALYEAATDSRLLPWQHEVLSDWLARTPDGKSVHTTCGLCVPRQNGKTHIDICLALYLSVVMHRKVLWTEHNYSTTVEMLGRFRSIFGRKPNDPDPPKNGFNALLVGVNSKTAQESMDLLGGGKIKFVTRTAATSLGESFDDIIYDEAQELEDAQAQAITPTTNAAPSHDAQVFKTGTPPRAGRHGGSSFQKTRKTAQEGGNGFTCWCEYGISELPDDVSDVSLWYESNPSLGIVTEESSIRNCLDSMSRLAFAQDCLGYWLPEATADSAFSDEEWSRLAISDDEARSIHGTTAYGVKFSPDGRTYAISAAIRPEEGSPYVELIDMADASHGIGGLASWISQRKDRVSVVVIDGKSYASTLAQALRDSGMRNRNAVIECGAQQVQAASSLLSDAVHSGALRHPASEALDASAEGSIRRKIGSAGGFGFGDGPAAISAPLESASLALWGAMTTKRHPGRRATVW